MNITSQISTNAVPILHGLAQQAGLNVSTQQVEELCGLAAVATRYLHLEAPKVRAGLAYMAAKTVQAGSWIEAHGGLRTIGRRLMGPKANLIANSKSPIDNAAAASGPIATNISHQ